MGKFTKIMWENSNQIIFLGTGTSQGVPPIGCKHPVCLSDNPKDKRLRASAMIHYHGKNILIDCGPDFRQQMLRENLDHIDAILITHEHNDHIIGMDDVRPLNFKSGKDMPIYGLPRVLDEIKMRFPYAFAKNKYPGTPSFDLRTVNDAPFFVDDVEIIPLQVMHGKLPILGYRMGNLAYMTDISEISNETLLQLNSLDILVIDALRKEPEHHSHLTLQQAITYAEKIQPKETYFIHMNQDMGFHDEVEKELPTNMHLAYDGLHVKFG